MHRRITMQFEFRKPDHMQRQMIWKRLLPARVKLDSDVPPLPPSRAHPLLATLALGPFRAECAIQYRPHSV